MPRPVVYVEEERILGTPYFTYRVMVDYAEYDQMTTTTRLTWSEQKDMAVGYAEALEFYKAFN